MPQPIRIGEISRLRVRTNRRGYVLPFSVTLGQRNAEFVHRPMTPLWRLFAWGDALAPLLDRDYDLVHSYNAIPVFTKRPYIVTFEDYMPRVPEDRYVGWLERWLQRRLVGDGCVALLALSEYARRQFVWQNRDFEGLERLEAKTEVLYPAVPLRRDRPREPSGELRILFVGTDFLRKGGPVALRAHERLRRLGVPVQTTVISALRWHDCYVAPHSPALVEAETTRLEQEGVTFYRGVHNEDVLRLMEETDYVVLPTMHDTFGLACLEALAGGTPVIATDTCALPEIIKHGRSGFLLPFPNDREVGKWVWIYRNSEPSYAEAYSAQVEALADALTERLMTCWESRDAYEALSAGALAQVREAFGVEEARTRLERLYERCRARGIR